MEGHGRSWKVMEGHGRAWKGMEGHAHLMEAAAVEHLVTFVLSRSEVEPEEYPFYSTAAFIRARLRQALP